MSDNVLLDAEAEDNLRRYLEIVIHIHQRIQADPEEYERFKSLTVQSLDFRMSDERSKRKERTLTSKGP